MAPTVTENVCTVERWLRIARERQADLAVFPEMMLTGCDLHLHRLFSREGWYEEIQCALTRIAEVVNQTKVTALLGTPYRVEAGCLNAVALLQPGQSPVLAGARKAMVEGWRAVWGFTTPDRKDPVDIAGILFGSVFCNEVSSLTELTGLGLEDSDVIVWPSVTLSHFDEAGEITRDGCREGAQSIARAFGVSVIQSSYVSMVSGLKENVLLGGSVVCGATSEIEQQASFHDEEVLVCEVRSSDAASLA
jgi:predicted amidohydrolase